MVKTGDFNPHYFLKPSLHFYYRMPFAAAGFLWEVKKGRARELKDIITKDTYGIGDYAFTASHPGVVKWVRGATLLLGLAIVWLCYSLVMILTGEKYAGYLAAFGAALAPALVENSTIVGVDTLTAFMSLLTVHEAVRLSKNYSLKKLCWISMLAGLTFSSKYNAFPIILVPVLTALFYFKEKVLAVAASVIVFAIGFYIGTPYALPELPLFLNHIAYEIWHYGIAGHVGHEGEPGLSQVIHYLKWLSFDGVGIVAMIAAISGVYLMFKRSVVYSVMILAYPLFFFLYMIMQKANFTRNMISIIPFIVCAGSIFIFEQLSIKKPKLSFLYLILAIIFIQPLLTTFASQLERSGLIDSRTLAEKWITDELNSGKKIMVAGELQFSPNIKKYNGITVVSDTGLKDKLQLLSESDYYISQMPLDGKIITEFKGIAGKQRIVMNPDIRVYESKTIKIKE